MNLGELLDKISASNNKNVIAEIIDLGFNVENLFQESKVEAMIKAN